MPVTLEEIYNKAGVETGTTPTLEQPGAVSATPTLESIGIGEDISPEERVRDQQERFKNVDPEVIKYIQNAEQAEISEKNYIAMLAALGVEVGGGVAGQLYSAQKFYTGSKVVSALGKAQKATALGVAGPQILEPWSTGSFLLSSGLFWGASNLAGQGIRNAYGLQNGISYGELMATAIFGSLTAPLMVPGAFTIGRKGAESQLLKLTGQTAGDFGAYKKGGYLIVNGAKSFVSGATLGVAETALRQELQIALNERENRDTYEYLFAAGFGGGVNSIFQVWGKAGWWGRRQRDEVTDAAKNNINLGINKLKEELADLKKGEGFVFLRNRKIKKIEQQIKDSEGAIDIIDSAIKEFKKVDEVQKKLESAEIKPDFYTEVPTNVGPKIKPTDEPSTLDDVKDLIKEREEIKLKEARAVARRREGKDVPEDFEGEQITLPKLKNKATVLSRDIDEEINNQIARIEQKKAKGEDAIIEHKKLRNLIHNKKELDIELIAEIDSSMGRTMLASRKDGGQFIDNTNKLSTAALERKNAYNKLIKAIDEKITSINSPAISAATYKGIFKTLDIKLEEIKKVNEQKAKAKRGTKQPPTIKPISEEVTKKEIEKLEKQLQSIRETGVDVGAKPKTVPKDLNKEKQILKDKIKFYKKAQKEIQQISKLQKELDDIYKLSPEEFKEMSEKARAKRELLNETKANKKIEELKAKIKTARTNLKRLANKSERSEKKAAILKYEKQILETLYGHGETRTSTFGRFVSRFSQLRKQAMLSVSSAAAGIPTGIYANLAEFVGSHSNLIASIFSRNKNTAAPLAFKIYQAEMSAFFTAIFDLKDNLKGAWISAKNMKDVTFDDGSYSKLGVTDGVPSRLEKGIVKSVASAESRESAVKRVLYKLKNNMLTGSFLASVEIGIRGIVGVDAFFKRPLAKMRTIADARRRAILQDHFEPQAGKSVSDIEKELFEGQWVMGSDGIKTLKLTEENAYDVNRISEELFTGSQADNIEDLHKSIVEIPVEFFEKVFKFHPLMELFGSVFMPFASVAMRSVYRGLRIASGPLGATLKSEPLSNLGTSRLGNPYLVKIKKLRKDIEIKQKEIDNAFEDLELPDADIRAFIQSRKDQILNINERLNRLEIRKAQYNKDIITDATMGSAFFGMGLMGSLSLDEKGERPLITGSLSFLDRETREKLEKIGVKPYTAFGIDYSSMLPFAIPILAAAEIGNYIVFDEKGYTKENDRSQNANSLLAMLSGLLSIVDELPFNQTGKMFSDLFLQGNREDRLSESNVRKLEKQLARMVGSNLILPADAKKLMKVVKNDGKIPDLYNATYDETVWYNAIGAGVKNYKRMWNGKPEKTQESLAKYFFRFGPDAPKNITKFDQIAAADVAGHLNIYLDVKINNLDLDKFRNKKGETLSSNFGDRLMKTKIDAEINKTIKKRSWKADFANGAISTDENGRQYNLGILELQQIIRGYHNDIKYEIENEKESFLKSYKNREGKTFFELLKENPEGVKEIDPFKIKN